MTGSGNFSADKAKHRFDKVQATSRGISDELINGLARSSLFPIDDIRFIADWSLII